MEGPLPPGAEMDWLRAEVSRFFPVYETRVTPVSLILLVHADSTNLESRFDELRRDLWPRYYVPRLRRESGEYLVEIVRRPRVNTWGFWVNVGLLAATIVTTAFAGAFLWLSFSGAMTLTLSDFVWGTVYFGVPLLAILGVHELAHYVVARHHHVEASLPYFLPVPPPFLIFGTFGAFISLREPIPSKKVLFDIGAAGPLAGFAMTIPITIGGMFLSVHAPAVSPAVCGPTILGVNYGNLLIGLPPLWSGLAFFVPSASSIVNLHPLALAGWVGLLVTAFNLLPAGQLDGGHVFRALLGDRSRYVSYGAIAVLFGLSLLTLYVGWALFAVLILLLGPRHPPPLNDVTPLGVTRYVVGALVVGLLVGGFALVPVATPGNSYALEPPTKIALTGTGFGLAEQINLTVENHDAVTHGYVPQTSVTAVYGFVNNRSVQLTGAALQSYLANSTWTVASPDGAVHTFVGVGTWTLATDQFVSIAAGGRATLTITYTNPQPAVLTVSLAASQLCNSGGGATPPGPQVVTF